nr:hypothetical protein [Tanacetum cinerariifolium]
MKLMNLFPSLIKKKKKRLKMMKKKMRRRRLLKLRPTILIRKMKQRLLIKQKKMEVLVTSSSHSSDLAAKFLNFANIPHLNAEIVSPLDVYVHHEVPIFQFNNLVTTLEKEVAELKKDDPLKTQVTALVDKHLDARLGATRDEFINFLSASLTIRITEQVKNQLPQILSEEVSNLAPPVIQRMLIDSNHKECYEGLKKSYDLNNTFFSTYGKVYSLKMSRKDKDKDPFAGSDRGLKKRKTRKDAESPKEEPEFEVTDSDMPHDQKENPNNDDEPKEKNVGKTPHQGQNQSWLISLASSAEKPSKTLDDLVSTPIVFSVFIMNGLNINNLTQVTLLGQAFRLLKGTRSNYAELKYDFEECYKALSKKLDWKNPKCGDYPFDLTKLLPLVKIGNRQKVPVDYFFNNDLKYLQGGISIMTYTTSLTKTKAAQYDLPGIKDIVLNICNPVKVAYDKHALWGISHWREQRKTFYAYARGLSKSKNKGKVPTEMELVLELTQQGTSYEVSVSAEGVEELKRKVTIKGEKKEALLILRLKPGIGVSTQLDDTMNDNTPVVVTYTVEEGVTPSVVDMMVEKEKISSLEDA